VFAFRPGDYGETLRTLTTSTPGRDPGFHTGVVLVWLRSCGVDEAEFTRRWPSHDVIERELDRLTLLQADAMGSLDTKAGLLAGFAAVLAGIAPSDTDPVRLAARLVAALAALAAVYAYWPQKEAEEIGPARLQRAYLAKPAHETRGMLLSTRIDVYGTNEDRLKQKFSRMRVAFALILVAVALLAADSIQDTLDCSSRRGCDQRNRAVTDKPEPAKDVPTAQVHPTADLPKADPEIIQLVVRKAEQPTARIEASRPEADLHFTSDRSSGSSQRE
jgi:hypothetical protein